MKLTVWHEGVEMGEISVDRNKWNFQYSRSWIEGPDAFPISPVIPLIANKVVDSREQKTVEWFFENLLPEGTVRDSIAKSLKISSRDTYGLLKLCGKESAGALTILPKGELYPTESGTEELTNTELEEIINNTEIKPMVTQGKMSLPGAQHKMLVCWDEKTNRPVKPIGNKPSTHILKPKNIQEKYPFCPANEYFCMSLAAKAGLTTPPVKLIREPEAIYICQRYDREVKDDQVVRKHQVDLMQLAGKSPDDKYQATIEDLFQALDKTITPALAKQKTIDLVVFNYLIGNSDAHGKNFSFIIDKNGVTLAPFYDLLSVKIYDDHYMAMPIGDNNKYGFIDARDWGKFSEVVGVKETYVKKVRSRLAESVPRLANELANDDAFSKDEKIFLSGVVGVIETHAKWLTEDMSESDDSSKKTEIKTKFKRV